MKRLGTAILLICALALPTSGAAHSLELLGGTFLQSQSRLFSGGLFWGNTPASLSPVWRVGGWILADRGSTPAPAPVIEAGWHLQSESGVWVAPMLGAGYVFLLDQAFFQTGLRIGWERFSLQGSVLFTRPTTTFVGVGYDFPF